MEVKHSQYFLSFILEDRYLPLLATNVTETEATWSVKSDKKISSSYAIKRKCVILTVSFQDLPTPLGFHVVHLLAKKKRSFNMVIWVISLG